MVDCLIAYSFQAMRLNILHFKLAKVKEGRQLWKLGMPYFFKA